MSLFTQSNFMSQRSIESIYIGICNHIGSEGVTGVIVASVALGSVGLLVVIHEIVKGCSRRQIRLHERQTFRALRPPRRLHDSEFESIPLEQRSSDDARTNVWPATAPW